MKKELGASNMVKIKGVSLPDDLYYTFDHLWAKVEEDGNVRVGFDNFGQKLSGRIIFIRLIGTGRKLKKGKYFGTLESGKWVGRLKSPISGTIIEVNEEVKTNVRLVNEYPYGYGWLIRIRPSTQKNLQEELDALVHGESIKLWLKKEIKKYHDKLVV